MPVLSVSPWFTVTVTLMLMSKSRQRHAVPAVVEPSALLPVAMNRPVGVTEPPTIVPP